MVIPISVFIPAKNEAKNIAECLKHLKWADEVFVVDSGSQDGTGTIAIEMGAKLVQFQWNGQWPKKKNWAIDNIPFRNDWVLIVDADEHITPELANEIGEAVSSPGEFQGFYINRKLIFLHRWIRHCGYYPSWNLRLFRRGKGHYEKLTTVEDTASGDNEVHEHLLIDGSTGWLKQDMLHYAYPTIADFVEKHNRYSNWEAHVERQGNSDGLPASLFGNVLQRRRWLKKFRTCLPFRPTLRFAYTYLIKLGFLDGWPGYVLSRLLAYYEFLSVQKRKAFELEDQIVKKSSTSPK